MCLCHGFRESESITLGLGADLARAVAEVVDSGIRLGVGCRFSDGLSDSFGGTLELGTNLARAITEMVGCFSVGCRCWCCGSLDGGDGHEGGEDERSDLHVDSS